MASSKPETYIYCRSLSKPPSKSDVVVISDRENAEKFITDLKKSDVLVVDTEYGQNDKEETKLSIIQCRIPEEQGCTVLFDVLRCPDITELLREILVSESILKVMHDSPNDCKVLWDVAKIAIKNVFDTRIVRQILDSMKNNKLLKDVKYVSLDTLCVEYGVDFDKSLKTEIKERLKSTKRDEKHYFLRRADDGSIPERMKSYSAQDVVALGNLYIKMKSVLPQEMQPLYKRLTEASLYRRLRDFPSRFVIYERDFKLFNYVATKDLASRQLSPPRRRRRRTQNR